MPNVVFRKEEHLQSVQRASAIPVGRLSLLLTMHYVVPRKCSTTAQCAGGRLKSGRRASDVGKGLLQVIFCPGQKAASRKPICVGKVLEEWTFDDEDPQ